MAESQRGRRVIEINQHVIGPRPAEDERGPPPQAERLSAPAGRVSRRGPLPLQPA